jgi:hypothetical protein
MVQKKEQYSLWINNQFYMTKHQRIYDKKVWEHNSTNHWIQTRDLNLQGNRISFSSDLRHQKKDQKGKGTFEIKRNK